MASATTATAAASAEPSVGAPAAQAAGVVPTDAHPAYAARVGRPGWEARWGSEEKERVAGAPAAAIAVEGAAAGFATAGGLGLDSPVSPAVAAAGSASSVNDGAGDHLMDDLPDGVEELKQMVRGEPVERGEEWERCTYPSKAWTEHVCLCVFWYSVVSMPCSRCVGDATVM